LFDDKFEKGEQMISSQFNKRYIYWLGVPIFTIIVIVGALYIYINSAYFRENIKSVLLSQLENSLGLKVEIGNIESISLQSLQLSDMTIFEHSLTKKDILFQAEKIEARFNLFFSLLHWKDWQLNIYEITFSRASLEISRERNGEFDLLNKLDLKIGEKQRKFFIERINFKDSMLTFHDKSVYSDHQDALTTQVNEIQGYLDLSQLSEINFNFQGRQEKDNAILGLLGKVFTNELAYSLSLHLENANILHFQSYFEFLKQLNITQGRFDLNLYLKSLPEEGLSGIFWQGETTLHHISAQPEILEGINLEDINGSIQFAKPEIKISQLKGFYQDSSVSLQGVFTIEPEPYFDLNLTAEKLDISRAIKSISVPVAYNSALPLQGRVSLSGNIKGKIDDFQVEAKFSSPEIKLEGIAFQNIDCSILLDGNTLLINTFSLQEAEGALNIKGKIDWSEDIPFYQFYIDTKHLSLQHPLFNYFSLPKDISGNVAGQFKVESDRQNSSVVRVEGQFMTADLKIKEIIFHDLLQGKIDSVIYLSDHDINIIFSEFDYQKAHTSLKGKINYSDLINFDLQFEGRAPEIKEVLSSTSLNIIAIPEGEVEIKGLLAGNLKNPEISAEFSLKKFILQDYLVDEIKGKLTFHQNIIYLKDCWLKNREICLNGKGDITLSESGSPKIDLFYQYDSVDLTWAAKNLKIPYPLSGQLSGSGNLQGMWPELTLKGNIQLEQIVYNNYPLGKGQLVFSLNPRQIEMNNTTDNLNGNRLGMANWAGSHSYSLNLEKFILNNEVLNLSVFGEIDWGGDYQFSGEINFSHQNLPEMVEYFYPCDNEKNNLKIFLPSKIIGKANLEGDRLEQKLTLSTLFTLPQQEAELPTKLESTIRRDSQGFTISDLHLVQPGGEFDLEGNISPDQKLDLNFKAEELDLNKLLSLTQIEEMIKGVMNIQGSCKGTISQPEISIITQIREGYFRELQFENLQSNLYWDSQSNIIEVRDLIVDSKQGYSLRARGNLPLAALNIFNRKNKEEVAPKSLIQDIPLNFQVKTNNADINILRLFWEEAFSEVSGWVDIDLNLTGTSRKPLINGAIEVKQGKIILADLPIEIKELNHKIEISNNRVTIPSVPFLIYDHNFSFSGQLELNNFIPDQISIIVRNEDKKFIYQDIIETEANLRGEIKGLFVEPEIEGQLVISKGNLNLDKLALLLADGRSGYSSLVAPHNLKGKLNIKIDFNDPFSLKLPNTELFITGKIDLNGSLAQPNVQGNILLKRGNFIYFEKKFEITDGLISINGFNAEDIEINAKAQTIVQDAKIIIFLSGNLINPRIRLSSEPPLKETEIISLLTLGRNIEGLSKGEIDQLLSKEIINIIFQSLQINILKRMEREIAGQLGLNLLRLSVDNLITSDNQTLLFEGLNLADLTLEVGKNVGENLFITYKTTLDFQGEKSMGINYKLSSTFSFNTQLDTYSFSLKENNYRLKFGLEFNF